MALVTLAPECPAARDRHRYSSLCHSPGERGHWNPCLARVQPTQADLNRGLQCDRSPGTSQVVVSSQPSRRAGPRSRRSFRPALRLGCGRSGTNPPGRARLARESDRAWRLAPGAAESGKHRDAARAPGLDRRRACAYVRRASLSMPRRGPGSVGWTGCRRAGISHTDCACRVTFVAARSQAPAEPRYRTDGAV